MSAEIQPKKIRLAENWAEFFKSQPNFARKKNRLRGLLLRFVYTVGADQPEISDRGGDGHGEKGPIAV